MRMGHRLTTLKGNLLYNLVGVSVIASGHRPIDRLVGRHLLSDTQLKRVTKKIRTLRPSFSTLADTFLVESKHHWKASLKRENIKEWIDYAAPRLEKAIKAEKRRLQKRDANSIRSHAVDAFHREGIQAATEKLAAMRKTYAMSDEDRKTVQEFIRKEFISELQAWFKLGPRDAHVAVEKKMMALKAELEEHLPEMAEGGWEKISSKENIAELGDLLEKRLPDAKRLELATRLQWTISTFPLLSSLRSKFVKQGIFNDCLLLRVAMERYRLRRERYPKTLQALLSLAPSCC